MPKGVNKEFNMALGNLFQVIPVSAIRNILSIVSNVKTITKEMEKGT
ncbi:MAG: hypothetical protein ACRCXT_19630 [Paraclostridium sp.]